LKEGLDSIVWRTYFGRHYGSLAKQTTQWMTSDPIST
jgi:hypothetical protein